MRDGVLTWHPASNSDRGHSIVLISGDEEYRSEEGLPMLARLLAERHGFTCHTLFAIDRESGEINPDEQGNIPGLALLADADLMIIATRFRNLPPDQMAHIDAYVQAGRPILGMRTATHAFALDGDYARYAWNYNGDPEYAGGFGRWILGETWIAHHGAHGRESTRGVLHPGAADHPIVRGIEDGDIWGPTDVYRVRLPLPDGCRVLVDGAILDGMSPDSNPVADDRNAPMIPVAWCREMPLGRGKTRRVFTTTMGAATDLESEGLRRLIVQGVYWLVGLDDDVPASGADVRLTWPFEPTDFGFGAYRRGMRPTDFVPGAQP